MITLRALIADDSETDVLLLVEELKRHNFEVIFRRVELTAELCEAMKNEHWDILLCDYVMPHLRGLDVLRLIKSSRWDIPTIIVSGKIGEEVAVEALHAGAYDYIMKNNLTRLAPAVQNALSEHVLRRERSAAQEAVYTRSRQQGAVAELGMRALSGIEVDELMKEAAILLSGVLAAQVCEVLELVPERSGFKLRAGVGWKKSLVGKTVIPAGLQSEAGFTVLSNEPVLVKDLRKDSRFAGPLVLLELGAVSGLSVPIHGKSMPFGVLGVHTTSPHEFDQTQVQFAQSIANLIGITIGRRQAEEEFMHLQKVESLGRLAGGVAHDFNNILTVITGYSELLLSRTSPQETTYHDIEEIKRAAAQAASLTRQLLVFSRKQLACPRVLAVNAVIEGMKDMLQRLIGEDIVLETTLSPDAGHIKIDPGHIQQILMNLSANARDAMPRGGRLIIETKKAELFAVLSVKDEGAGMNANTLSHLFEPFFTTKEQGQGTGLGLATVDAIVRQAGGHVEVESHLGEGSAFRVFLPVVNEQTEQMATRPQTPESLLGTETVLVVEDEDVIRSLAQRILVERGYHVLSARHGEEALTLCEMHDGAIDLVLTDMIMPKMGGRQFIDSLSKKYINTKILYMSGYTDRMAEERGLIKEGFNFLQKPFTPNDLIVRVRELLDMKK